MNTTDQMTDRACQHCGGSMEGKRPQAIHCGERCRDQARRQREREARQTDPRPRGNYPTSRPNQRKHRPGNVYGPLTLVERIEGSGEPRALFRCGCGNVKALRIGNVASGVTANCTDRANHPDPRRKDVLTYDGAHNRVKGQRGSASQYNCRCGNQAEHWSYSHADHDQARMPEGREAGKPYSTNPDHYTPRCRGCHARFDNSHRRMAGGPLSLVHVALFMATSDEDAA
ncbi:hypothetical protein F4558_000431 [Micromonospora profundi]|uniref:hypothetical protein n=1 Tax=Micromonospora profundi TaxID=1420889 RepID=UPI00143B03D4|nr:hypothetical protein [Micromonospora profundi]NJC10605.1 hypothetical protein [Micromonospora profundi]